ncbi:DEAD/DEAH box helicase [Lihuaxuella thermophila]|uniref:Competence protein ComFA n=1 Tax=Lihuaxuella thermophila TaxID=1173111 RepID=A0A1H8B6Q3_9BACL|nr:helicase-related protein [Lihuaxuella thermophila]SEM78601.1 competence protein ComFA [Lihuaxuella thermophila]
MSGSVDRTYWRKKGIAIEPVAEAASVGTAFEWLGENRWSDSPFIDPHLRKYTEKELGEREWQETVQLAEECQPVLAGRSLLWPEVEALLHKRGKKVHQTVLARVLQFLYLQEQMSLKPGVEIAGPAAEWICHRCCTKGAGLRVTACAMCGDKCAVCERCLLLGKSRTCIPFFQFIHPGRRVPENGAVSVSLSFSLTPTQQAVADHIVRFLTSDHRRLLVWAVTGAGKTEMMVPAISSVLSQGGKVLWTTPRKDVVHELGPRLQKIFRGIQVRSLYGGSPDLWLDGPLVISTAHQTWRLYQDFDLVVVDEADAFPLYGNPSLEAGIERSMKQGAKQIFLTATPPREWKKLLRAGILSAVTVPVRYHGYPLPVPKLLREWRLWKKLSEGRPIPHLSSFLRQAETKGGQVFLFVPRVQDVKKVLGWLKEQEPDFFSRAAGVFGQDRLREETIRAFRQERIQVLVTTTILERGVTVPRGHVLVIGADHPVFDRASLIQIAGRVGRSGEYQQGVAWFLAGEKTEAQIQAKKETEWLNQLARTTLWKKEDRF